MKKNIICFSITLAALFSAQINAIPRFPNFFPGIAVGAGLAMVAQQKPHYFLAGAYMINKVHSLSQTKDLETIKNENPSLAQAAKAVQENPASTTPQALKAQGEIVLRKSMPGLMLVTTGIYFLLRKKPPRF